MVFLRVKEYEMLVDISHEPTTNKLKQRTRDISCTHRLGITHRHVISKANRASDCVVVYGPIDDGLSFLFHVFCALDCELKWPKTCIDMPSLLTIE